ncbi:MAG: protein kinase, partial [Planctomycetota bacterium]|nr:protein kinase [Planctomycetota bacterium]
MVDPVIPLESHLGPYRVLRQIGEGGMGVVYLGEDPQTGQHVALKVLASQDKAEKSKALVDEALMARRIDHPNCVAVYGVVDGPGETPVIVSEFVDGVDARQFLDSPLFRQSSEKPFRFSPLASLLIIEQMFRGLRVAHKIGITHQDIKPQNYLVAQWLVDEIESLAHSEGSITNAHLEALFLANREKAWIKLCDWGLALFQNKKIVGQGSVSMNYSKVAGEKRGGTLVY